MHIQQNKGNENAIVARQYHNPHSPYKTKEGAKPVIQAKQRPVDRSAARAQTLGYATTPAPTAQSTAGGYYSRSGNYLGSHDQANGTIYLVTNKKERKAIKKAHKKGACTPLSEVRSAVVLPSYAVRQAMLEAVKRSNSPNTSPEVGDKQGGFHEEGGMFGTDRQGNEKVIPAKPGKYARPAEGVQAEVDVFSGETKTNGLHIINGTYHVHPKGTAVDKNGKEYWFDQAPSHNKEKNEGDIPNAQKHAKADPNNGYHVTGNSYVIGARDKTVYIYNGNGVVATMPLKHFIKIK